MEESLGERIKHRRGRALTQGQLAELVGISKSMVSQIEQDKRTPSIPVLQRIAAALDVDIRDLLGTKKSLPSTDPAAGIVAIRRALTPVDDLMQGSDEALQVSLSDAERTVDRAWGAYSFGRFELLAGLLPSGITRVRAAAHAAQGNEIPSAHEYLARINWVAGCALVHFGQPDLASIAIRDALAAAEKGNDELLLAALRGSVSWQLLVSGRHEEAHAVALQAAASIEPNGAASEQNLAVHGALLLQGATAAGRGQRVHEALALTEEAGAVAARIGRDTKWYESDFGPSQQVMQTVDINISNERFAEAMHAAKAMPNRGLGLTPVAQGRHLVDKAAAAVQLGQYQLALDLLLTAERVVGKEWVRYQTLLRTVVGVLLQHDRRTALREFAQRVGVSA
ncbi:helix-turn-helix transcriptional regulator [Nocardia sp. 2]|uniref:Helix-turn-helix transcriptional regulator n=1 Tax=Nocardia acididurans TaxID=2802282 RepID=A0ABS1MDI6_9NOCA|nr:helix-turn-helix transcriptional regulator [Nocardia acididurans]MBL1077243.1 helix-turn-helix transcriptional regulator [Nocardia acididurans]